MSGIIYLFVCSLAALCTGDEFIELNHDLSPSSTYWPLANAQEFSHEALSVGFDRGGGYWYAAYKFSGPEHLGTHIDAPFHYAERGWKVDEIPVNRLIAPVSVIDIREKVMKNNIAELTADDVVKWVDKHGPFPNNSVVLVSTGWDKRYNDRTSYYGHESDVTKFIFPGVSPSAAQTLIGYKASSGVQIVGVGIDGPSLDFGPSKEKMTHRELSAANIYLLENLKDLQKVPTVGAELIVMPMKIKGGSGAPSRVIARVPQNNGSQAFHFSLILLAMCATFLLFLSKL